VVFKTVAEIKGNRETAGANSVPTLLDSLNRKEKKKRLQKINNDLI